jgi:light-regulated signal transduction histidine kinase (bacteriophytochrome)
MSLRRVSQIAVQHLMAMGTGVSIEIIAKLDATTWTFCSKHNSTKAREVPPLRRGFN